jgi:hypothetical protein
MGGDVAVCRIPELLMTHPASSSSRGDGPRLQARVILGSPGGLPEQDERLLLDVLSDCGAEGRVETVDVRRGDNATLAWVVLAALPLQAFLSALGGKAAEDTYAKLRALTGRLARGHRSREAAPAAGRQAPARSPAPLILLDSDTGLQIVLEADLPADAYRELVAMDLSKFSIGPLHYDQARRRWRSERDEAAS